MKKITIAGKFTGSVNNFVILDVFRPNRLKNPYDFNKSFNENFKEVLNDLQPDTSYNIDVTGFTTGQFDLTISGDFSNSPINFSATQDFSKGFIIKTNS